MNERPSTGQLEQAGEKAKSVAREGADALTGAKARVTDTLRDVAGTVKEAASHSSVGRSVSAFADEASDQVASATDYVRETASADLWRDFVGIVKSRPIESLATAAVLGFFVGRAARKL
jgi:ElaB/YqjD/DUF883 family membrane-anchored ribosome-binding protein